MRGSPRHLAKLSEGRIRAVQARGDSQRTLRLARQWLWLLRPLGSAAPSFERLTHLRRLVRKYRLDNSAGVVKQRNEKRLMDDDLAEAVAFVG